MVVIANVRSVLRLAIVSGTIVRNNAQLVSAILDFATTAAAAAQHQQLALTAVETNRTAVTCVRKKCSTKSTLQQ